MAKKVTVQQRILETASNLFYHQGFNNTGINQIIAEAGIAIGSLYKHYKSKNDLLYSYLEKQETEYFVNLNEHLKDETDPKKKLLKLISYRIQLQNQANYSGCHFIKINAELGRRDERVNELVINHKNKQNTYLREIIDEIGASQIRPLQTTLLTSSIFLMIEGAVVSATIQGNTNDFDSIKDYVQQVF